MNSNYIAIYFIITIIINITTFIYIYEYKIKGEKIKNESIIYGPTV